MCFHFVTNRKQEEKKEKRNKMGKPAHTQRQTQYIIVLLDIFLYITYVHVRPNIYFFSERISLKKIKQTYWGARRRRWKRLDIDGDVPAVRNRKCSSLNSTPPPPAPPTLTDEFTHVPWSKVSGSLVQIFSPPRKSTTKFPDAVDSPITLSHIQVQSKKRKKNNQKIRKKKKIKLKTSSEYKLLLGHLLVLDTRGRHSSPGPETKRLDLAAPVFFFFFIIVLVPFLYFLCSFLPFFSTSLFLMCPRFLLAVYTHTHTQDLF